MKKPFIQFADKSSQGMQGALQLIIDNEVILNQNLETIYQALEEFEIKIKGNEKRL